MHVVMFTAYVLCKNDIIAVISIKIDCILRVHLCKGRIFYFIFVFLPSLCKGRNFYISYLIYIF